MKEKEKNGRSPGVENAGSQRKKAKQKEEHAEMKRWKWTEEVENAGVREGRGEEARSEGETQGPSEKKAETKQGDKGGVETKEKDERHSDATDSDSEIEVVGIAIPVSKFASRSTPSSSSSSSSPPASPEKRASSAHGGGASSSFLPRVCSSTLSEESRELETKEAKRPGHRRSGQEERERQRDHACAVDKNSGNSRLSFEGDMLRRSGQTGRIGGVTGKDKCSEPVEDLLETEDRVETQRGCSDGSQQEEGEKKASNVQHTVVISSEEDEDERNAADSRNNIPQQRSGLMCLSSPSGKISSSLSSPSLPPPSFVEDRQ